MGYLYQGRRGSICGAQYNDSATALQCRQLRDGNCASMEPIYPCSAHRSALSSSDATRSIMPLRRQGAVLAVCQAGAAFWSKMGTPVAIAQMSADRQLPTRTLGLRAWLEGRFTREFNKARREPAERVMNIQPEAATRLTGQPPAWINQRPADRLRCPVSAASSSPPLRQ